MQAAPITLFDFDSELETPFSPKVWAIRLLLNYKEIPHKTTYVHFPDIGTVLAAAGAPPTRQVAPLYTVPAIIDGDKAISDSRLIAGHIERTYPARPVPLQGDAQQLAVRNVEFLFYPLIVPNTMNHLDERDAAYFIQTRRVMFRKELHEICPPSRREEAVRAIEAGLIELSDFVGAESHEGWVFGKDGPAYADFELLRLFLWLKIAGFPGAWDRIKELNGAKWGRLFIAAEPYINIE
ncbi:hypothetical protein DFH08DRAFT_1087194 [Mycena albidolilacea]|uniref:GST N-terminal domain-containing protein n=1 Tax=Mycena albidolilacea TaxID=1033008 RepID=A0AAD7EE99_9AGAR|nr:hypothetical protein DFH08DRAFT_1087194 [Mycena albidolilacea]